MNGLYLVTPDWDDTERLLQVTEQALMGGAALVQYRHKTADAAQRLTQARALLALCRCFACPLIINDHADLCLALDADGVHVGGTDASVAQLRDLLGPDKIVGASCYGDLQLAYHAQRSGASYVAFGGFYPSRVKQYPVTTAPEIIAQARAVMDLPVVVIGGMTVDNARPLVAQGAQMVAAISSVYGAIDPRHSARALCDLFT
ncbi:thiamine phosphate synthase [Actimicrobium sp. CCI2.3]|uniref:thiamine phosphate synthase n=1 Tax=Actimicrobium sp. CCI2.3 TaxID=3048616 RepID=UPI002AB5C9D4|nr:thiamine phosphate synthase [Actimicrobium sp. CCI2.3]MDY7573707.1 thiamine phosphate synthase [Actimicrobium sp. CCI2.3]MEB0021021.1 thiamine phosphate synthase [Actimicrobium sp. CCI2.3]